MGELTAWQEIGPMATASVEQGERRWLSATAYVLRTDTDTILAELTHSLAMVAPGGWSEEDREQWLAAAALTLRDADIPPSYFADAVKAARRDTQCDHPAKIVPAIMRALGEFEPHVVKLPDPASQEAARSSAEAHAKAEAALNRLIDRTATQAEIDALPDRLKQIAWNRCLLTTDYEGSYWLAGARAA